MYFLPFSCALTNALLIVDGLADLLGVSPLSPSGAPEKRSSVWKPLDDSRALDLFLRLPGLVICFRFSKCRPP
ncbi:hypothetical protein NPIL_427991 [Nephila pilipes]|uniref:Secreted protein n=1 Tax=Nephila pilipes TaxID=299642 RepID=A0A8X6TLF1_NEPPI|nr:hypothetical protein NPIL_427991 [Nephila pilipes]